MKNFILFSLFSLLLSSGLMAQGSSRIGQHESLTTWKDVNGSPAASFSSATEGRRIIQDIIDVIGLKANFEIQAANVPNAAAVVYRGTRYVLYNPTFINNLVRTTGSKWAAVSVLAHEVGHHLNGHTLSGSGSQPAVELEADEFSGFVLRKMGASLQDAQAAMRLLASQHASRTHPGQDDRLASIARGWNKAAGQGGNRAIARSETVIPPREQQPQTTAQADTRVTNSHPSRAALTSRDILSEVYFNADRSSRFFVTTGFNLVQLRDNRTTVIGKVSRLNSSRYPFLIHDESNTQLLVSSQGRILTPAGREVGKMRTYRA